MKPGTYGTEAPAFDDTPHQMSGPVWTVVICAAILAGCATPTATIPVAISCIKGDPPAKPETTDEAAILAMDDYAATLTVWTERLLLKAYGEKADAVIQACR